MVSVLRSGGDTPPSPPSAQGRSWAQSLQESFHQEKSSHKVRLIDGKRPVKRLNTPYHTHREAATQTILSQPGVLNELVSAAPLRWTKEASSQLLGHPGVSSWSHLEGKQTTERGQATTQLCAAAHLPCHSAAGSSSQGAASACRDLRSSAWLLPGTSPLPAHPSCRGGFKCLFLKSLIYSQ